MPLSIDFPSFIKPEIIPGLPIRWYGLMYVFAFATAYLLFKRQVKERNFPMSGDELVSLFSWGIVGLIIGARLFSTIVYEPPATNIYFRKPWLIFIPFRNGEFTGFQGMSYHGGVIGCFLAVALWSKKHNFNFREICDMTSVSIPLGYTFGRLGNFINAELYGRVTDAPIGMVFPIPEWDSVNRFKSAVPWVREMAEKTGVALPASPDVLINLPRHPSQLYEAFFEGIVLWLILWLLRKRSPFKGFLFGLYIAGYALVRFIIEYFREPDADLGYRLQFGEVVGIRDIAHLHPVLSFSTGQILCFIMFLAAVLWWVVCANLPESRFIYFYEKSGAEGEGAATVHARKKNARRNRRRKLK